MARTIHPLVVVAVVLVATLFLGARPVENPLSVLLTTSDPPASPHFLAISDDVDVEYVHDDDDVHAALSGTENIVLDPDRYAHGNGGRYILLSGEEIHWGTQGRKAYFMSINAVGLDCARPDAGESEATAQTLLLNQCIQSDVAVNDIAGTKWFLRCGGTKNQTDLDPDHPSELPERYGLTNVDVTCTAQIGTSCTEWSVSPHETSLTCGVFTFKKGKFIRVPGLPDFDTAFSATVTRQ